MRVLIQVAQDDIDNGVQECPSYCPVALALDRAVGPCDEIYIVRGTMRFLKDKVVWGVSIPKIAVRFITGFDKWTETRPKPKPFEFEVEFEEVETLDLEDGEMFGGSEKLMPDLTDID